MDLSHYQRQALKTALYRQKGRSPVHSLAKVLKGLGKVNEAAERLERLFYLTYPLVGVFSELGEIAGKLKRVFRGEKELDEALRQDVGKEIGDLLWYLAALCDELGLDLGAIAQQNIEKVISRKTRGTIYGEGDNR